MDSREDSPLVNKPSHRLKNDNRLFSRWQSFCGICMYVSVAGTTYAFAVYSQLLKKDLGYSQSSLDLIASIGTTGLYMSVLAGFAIEKIGYRTVMFYGNTFIFVGFMYIYLAIIQSIPSNIYSVSFFYFLSQTGVCCHITSAVAVAVKLFPPESRGVAIGLAKGYFGLSTAVLGNLAGGYFQTEPAHFLVFIALFIPIVGFIGSSVANVLPEHLVGFEYEQRRGLATSMRPVVSHWGLLFVSLLLLGYVQYMYELGQGTVTFLSLLLLTLIFSVQLLPGLYGPRILPAEDCDPLSGGESSRDSRLRKPFNFSDSAADRLEALPDEQGSGFCETEELLAGKTLISGQQAIVARHTSRGALSDGDEEPSGPVEAAPQHQHQQCFYGESIPLSESIRTWRLWTLFLSFLVSCGAGLMVIYNVNAIAQAANLRPSAFFVTLISLTNGLGRVVAGLGSDSATQTLRVSKLQLSGVAVTLMGLAQVLLSVGSSALLFPCFLAVGFLFGCNVSLTAVNVADVFGAKYIATNFGFVDTSPILGSYVFATIAVALLYRDDEALDGTLTACVGPHCFRPCFVFNALCCFAAGAALLYMHSQTPRPLGNNVSRQ